MNALPMWRSLLYVPANMERFIERAAQRGADAIQLDLEDSVAPAEKSAARATIAATAARLAHEGATVLVRINRPLTLAILDLEASLSPHVTGVILPKVSGPEHIRLIAEAIGELERLRGMPVGSTRLVALIETAEAALRIAEIGAADPRLVAITLGTEDLSADLGCSPDSPVFETLSAQLVVAARAANVLPLGLVGSIAGIDDLESFRLVARRSRAFGLAGASCVHPSQVPILNEEFSPTGRELERAQSIVEAYDAALARGSGAIMIDGKMIDVPVAERARALLARYASAQHGRKGFDS